MSNKDVLTQAEFDSYRPPPIMIDHIERFRSRFGAAKADFRIVDWGCGRGKLVLWLREHGYDAVGVDLDPKPFANGADLFRSKGYEVEECLYGLDPESTAPFADSSFHFVTSWQTFEHVLDLEAVAAELGRVTMNGGGGLHIYPAHRRVVEAHLCMPFVHWLPKNLSRRWLIGLFVLFGIEPNWWPNKRVDWREKVRTYYRFSVQETFYRTPEAVSGSLAARGFQTEFMDVRAWDSGRKLARKWLGRTWFMNYGGNLGLATFLQKERHAPAEPTDAAVSLPVSLPVSPGKVRRGCGRNPAPTPDFPL